MCGLEALKIDLKGLKEDEKSLRFGLGDDYNAIFKHVGDWNDWTEFQSIKKDTDEYFESTVTEAVLEELQSAGLRFQGLGFTIVEVHLIP